MRTIARLAGAAALALAAGSWGVQANAQTDQDHGALHPDSTPTQILPTPVPGQAGAASGRSGRMAGMPGGPQGPESGQGTPMGAMMP
jgi:hypothetical protein